MANTRSGIDPVLREELLRDPEVVIHRRDPRKPAKPYEPVLRVTRPVSLDDLLIDDDNDDANSQVN